MDRFMTLQEIADATQRHALKNLPASRFGWSKRAKAEGWGENSDLARKRQGEVGGGGMEYHVSLLPERLRLALRGEVLKNTCVATTKQNRAVDIAKREALDTTALSARQRQVMNARSQVLAAIETMQFSQDYTRSQTVDRFVAGELDFGLDTDTIATANDRSNGSVSISRATILRWFQYRDGTGIGALAPKATKERAEIPSWFWDFLTHYARPQKPCITEALDAFLRVNHGINEPITYTKVRRLIGKLGNVEKHRGREGSLTLKARMAYVTRSTADLLPTCVYTSDGKTFDAEVAHPLHGRPFRPEITPVVDVATRKCVGFSVGLAENAVGVVDALRFSCEQFGVPAIFYVDRGPGFKNGVLDARLTGLMGRLGITKYHSLPQNSQARGIIERFQGSVWNKLSREFDTYVGAPMDRQARQKSFKVTRREIKEFGKSASLPTWEEFLESCRRAIREYNSKPHASLPNRMSPDEYWQWHVDNGFEPVTVTEAESADLFRPYEKRKTRRCLIEFNTNKYFHKDLQEYDGDWVLVGYDIHNADHVWVREIDEVKSEEQPGRLICIAKFGGNEARFVPLTMEQKAMEDRAKQASKRLAEKQTAIDEELRPPHMLEGRTQMPMPSFSVREPSPVIEGDFTRIGEGSDVTEACALNTAPRFATDADLAFWAIDNPVDLHPSQIEVLAECVNDSWHRQGLKDLGVDVDALTEVLRRAVAAAKDAN